MMEGGRKFEKDSETGMSREKKRESRVYMRKKQKRGEKFSESAEELLSEGLSPSYYVVPVVCKHRAFSWRADSAFITAQNYTPPRSLQSIFSSSQWKCTNKQKDWWAIKYLTPDEKGMNRIGYIYIYPKQQTNEEHHLGQYFRCLLSLHLLH